MSCLADTLEYFNSLIERFYQIMPEIKLTCHVIQVELGKLVKSNFRGKDLLFKPKFYWIVCERTKGVPMKTVILAGG